MTHHTYIYKTCRIVLAAVLLFVTNLTVKAQDGNAPAGVIITRNNGGCKYIMQLPMADARFMRVSDDGLNVTFAAGNQSYSFPVSELEGVTFGEIDTDITVTYGESGVTVVNPYALRGLLVNFGQDNAIVVNNSIDEKLNYLLTGSGVGSFKLYSVKKQDIKLQDLNLTSKDGPAINIQTSKSTDIKLAGINVLSDSKTYTAFEDEDMKGCIFSEGQLIFKGSGELSISSVKKHAICSDDYIVVEKGSITISGAGKDGIHAKDYFEMTGGTLTISGTADDCIDGGTIDPEETDPEKDGHITISGGTLNLTAAEADTKAIKCDGVLTISDKADLTITLSGDITKGLKSATAIKMLGGSITTTATGNAVVEGDDVSYCAAVKCDGDILFSDGTFTLNHSGKAGKGFSADGNITIEGGTMTMNLTGNGDSFTLSTGELDKYSATAIKSDASLVISGGDLTLRTEGSGGKCINTNGSAIFGKEDGTGPNITATTTGAAIPGGNTGGGGWWVDEPVKLYGPGGGGWPGGGGRPGDSSGTGGKPKAIKAEGDLTVYGGHYILSSQQDGGEGLESKATLTINGGTIECQTYDDCINAKTAIVINGGDIYAYASNNDGIDSNGTITINGGRIVACGSTTPEEGFDCDNNMFKITGGVFVGFGGATSSPTSSACTQATARMSGSISTTTTYTLVDAEGNQVMSFTSPRQLGNGTTIFSAPVMQRGASFKLYTGGTIEGGTTFKGLTTGATYTPGTQTKSFTINSMFQTI